MPQKFKVALITGASGALGSVYSQLLAEANLGVALADIDPGKAEVIAADVRAEGRPAVAVGMDVANLSQVRKAVNQVKTELGPIDILVNNAATGMVRAVTTDKMKKADWDLDLSVNLTGVFNTIKCCMPDMIERGWGRIINIISVVGTMGGRGQCSYAASKAGLIGLTKTVALEGARNGVTCNAVVLGGFDVASFSQVADGFKERITKRVALRRLGNAEEAGNMIVFLASEKSSYITGEMIEVSGGLGLFTF